MFWCKHFTSLSYILCSDHSLARNILKQKKNNKTGYILSLRFYLLPILVHFSRIKSFKEYVKFFCVLKENWSLAVQNVARTSQD